MTAPDPGALYLQDHQPVELQKYRGKPLVLLFFSNSCCNDELEKLAAFFTEQRRAEMRILGINVGDSFESVRRVAEKKQLPFPLAYDPIATTRHRYRLIAVPTIFIVDQEGTVLERIIGKVPSDQLVSKILRTLELKEGT